MSDVLVRGVPEATPEDYQRSREAMVDLGDDDAMRAAWS
ncbi:hypothetical protein JOD66_002656 [Nocardioides nitrophenolicus]|nr:hypothetical protein [Nocardioides nitrophenolicus]